MREEEVKRRTKRREFLLRAAAGALGWAAARTSAPARPAPDAEDPNVFVFPRLRYTTLTRVIGEWNADPSGDERFLAFLKQETNIKVSEKTWAERVIDIRELGRAFRDPESEEHVFSLPFIFMTGEGEFRFSGDEAETLREYFKRGGFLYADDCSFTSGGRKNDFLYKAFLREIRKVQPEDPMRPVPHEHEIYHCVYEFPRGAPLGPRRLPHPDMGLFIEGRLVAFLTNGDLHCGWTERLFPAPVNEDCLKMGVNIIVYALTH